MLKRNVKMSYKLIVNRLIHRCNNLMYRFKYHVLKILIIWYAGRNKGTLVVTGKPNFSRPLTWTKYTLKGKKYTENEVKNGR